MNTPETTARARRLPWLLGLLWLLPQCSFQHESGDADSGCGDVGTVGHYGRARFVFEGAENEDVTQATFAVGTRSAFTVFRAGEEELPRLYAETEDEDVFQVSAAPDADARYEILFRGPGHSALRLVESPGADVFDETWLRVAEPQGLRLTVTGFLSGPAYPTRAWVPPDAGFALKPRLVGAGGDALWGTYEPAISGVQHTALSAVIAGASGPTLEMRSTTEGTDLVRVEGPGGLSDELEIVVTPSPDATELVLVDLSDSGEDPTQGETLLLVAQIPVSEGEVALGYPIAMSCSRPSAIEVVSASPEHGVFLVTLLAPGEVTLYATLGTDPRLWGELTLRVAPAETPASR